MSDDQKCGEPNECRMVREPDGERIWIHCNNHCPRVRKGDWPDCRGC